MATKVLFRRIGGRIVPIRVAKAQAKTMQGGDRAVMSFLKKQVRKKASGIFGKAKGLTGWYGEHAVHKGSSIIPRSKGGFMVLANTFEYKAPVSEARFVSKTAAVKWLNKLKKLKKPGSGNGIPF